MTLVDPRGARDVRPPSSQFLSFSCNFRPLLVREILDLPLYNEVFLFMLNELKGLY